MFKINKTAGVDEVGRGCLAGPVFAAAVILKNKINTKNIKDSKKIPFKKRILLSKYIKKKLYICYWIGKCKRNRKNKYFKCFSFINAKSFRKTKI